MKRVLIPLVLFYCFSCHFDNLDTRRAKENFGGYKEKYQDERTSLIDPGDEFIHKIALSPTDKEARLKVDDLIDSIYCIRLETHRSAPISEVDRIFFFEGKILVCDKGGRSGIYLFSSNGEFITQVGRFGKGPQEYLNVSDVSFDKQTRCILILDEYSKQILFFDSDGKFIKKEKLFFYAKDFSVLQDGSFVFYQLEGVNAHLEKNQDYCLLFSTNDQTIRSFAFPYSYRHKFPQIRRGNNIDLINSGDKTFFNPFLTNSIYEIASSGSIIAKYIIDFGKDDLLRYLNEQTTDQEYLKILNNSNPLHLNGHIQEAGTNLFFQYGKSDFCFYNNVSKNLKYGHSFSYLYQMNRFNINVFVRPPIASYDNYFVNLIWPYELPKEIKEMIENSDSRAIQGLRGISDQSNPILVFYKLKEF